RKPGQRHCFRVFAGESAVIFQAGSALLEGDSQIVELFSPPKRYLRYLRYQIVFIGQIGSAGSAGSVQSGGSQIELKKVIEVRPVVALADHTIDLHVPRSDAVWLEPYGKAPLINRLALYVSPRALLAIT